MKTLIFVASPNALLVVDGEQVYGGESFTVTNDRAEELLAQDIPLQEDAKEASEPTPTEPKQQHSSSPFVDEPKEKKE